jgi:hypothetical protein
MKRFFLTLNILALVAGLFAQDMKYARNVIDEICSPKYYGRGYVNYGD